MRLFLILFAFLPLAAAEPTLVYFVRHAEKVDSSDESDLSPAGYERVAMLRRFFEKTEIHVVVATQYRRTQNTVASMAADRDLSVTVIPAGEPEKLKALIGRSPGKTLLVAGHSNTVPDLIGHLGCEAPTIDHRQYSFLFLVVLDEGNCILQTWQLDP